MEELSELLRIPSISADPERKDDVRRAAEWVAEAVRRMGGEAELVETDTFPLVVGEVRASSGGDAPTVLCYGHFDVQPAGPADEWETDPFEPEVRDGWLYARGVADDKGQLWALLKATEELAAAGELPVNVRFVCDGEEETGGHQVVEFIASDERGADAAVIFDSAMLRRIRRETSLGLHELSLASVAVPALRVERRDGDVHEALQEVALGLRSRPPLVLELLVCIEVRALTDQLESFAKRHHGRLSASVGGASVATWRRSCSSGSTCSSAGNWKGCFRIIGS